MCVEQLRARYNYPQNLDLILRVELQIYKLKEMRALLNIPEREAGMVYLTDVLNSTATIVREVCMSLSCFARVAQFLLNCKIGGFINNSWEVSFFDTLRRAFEENFNSAGMKANIEKWEAEREALVMEEHEIQKATKDFYEQSNSLLRFCNDCYKAFLDGSAEQKRKIINIVCSNFTYDGEILYIEPIPAFKVIMQNALNIKKLPRLDSNQQPTG